MLRSTQLITFCSYVFDQHPRYRTFFSFEKGKVKLVLEDFRETPKFPYGEVHISKLEVIRKERGRGLASIALTALCEGADYCQVPLSLTPASYADERGLHQRQLEAFYRRYGFRAEYGKVETMQDGSRCITGMVRYPK